MAEAHVLTALYRKYAELKGEAQKHEAKAATIYMDMAHVEATIRLFKPDVKVSDISGVSCKKAVRWRKAGIGIRTALQVLKEAGEPLTTTQIATEVIRRAGGSIHDKQTIVDVAASLRGSLGRRIGKGVVVVEGRPRRWAFAIPS